MRVAIHSLVASVAIIFSVQGQHAPRWSLVNELQFCRYIRKHWGVADRVAMHFGVLSLIELAGSVPMSSLLLRRK